jgi:hypothetical protein
MNKNWLYVLALPFIFGCAAPALTESVAKVDATVVIVPADQFEGVRVRYYEMVNDLTGVQKKLTECREQLYPFADYDNYHR